MVDQVIANRYRLGRELGAGGMARVVAAHDLRLDRAVAIKLVPVAGIDRAGRERFVREARSSAGFTHPNAVAVFDAGEGDGFLYLVMELVDGPSLATRLTEHGRLDLPESLRITERVLAALGAAHAAGIVHRDVKPGNILLSSSGEVKLADFGIAKRLDDMAADLTSSGQFVGTPKYLAPEQVAGERPTAATDVYAVGIVLYEMLAGRPPFDAGDPVATAVAHRDAPIPDLHATRPDVPDYVVAAIRRAMAKDPAQRFESAGQMATALAPPVDTTVAMPAPVVATPAAARNAPEPTQILLAPRGSGRRVKPWWWAAAAGLLVGGGAALALAQRDDDPDASAGSTTTGAAPATTATPATTVAPATTPPPSTVPDTTAPPPTTPPPTTTPPPPPPPASIEELIALVEANPDRYGSKAPEFVDELRKIAEENGRKQSDRAEKLLEQTDEWVANGELSAELVPVTELLLTPIADAPGNDGGGPGNDNGGPGNGNEDD